MKRRIIRPTLLAVILCVCAPQANVVTDDAQVIESGLVYIRIDGEREWASFADKPNANALIREFQSTKNGKPWTISHRQFDVKQQWEVRVNDKLLGRLVQHEEDMVALFEVPGGVVIDGKNQLAIKHTGKQTPDDISVGEIELHRMPVKSFHDAIVSVNIVDQDDRLLPGRITLVNDKGVLVPLTTNHDHLASEHVPIGLFHIFANRFDIKLIMAM